MNGNTRMFLGVLNGQFLHLKGPIGHSLIDTNIRISILYASIL